MKIRILLTFIIASLSFGAKSQTTIVDSFLCDGVYRSYRLYIPANYVASAQHPFILNMHGLGSNALEQQYYSNFMPIADTAQFLMAYPQGLSYFNYPYWSCGIPNFPQTNDVKFLSALIDTVSKHYTVDAQRVFATGMSMGGYMSHYLALKLNSRITAIASVTGSMDPSIYPPSPAPARAIPVMQVHGTADATVAYNGYANGIAIDTLVKYWVVKNGCNATPAHTNLPNVNTTDGCTAERFVWSGGTHGATVELFRINGGGHSWPGAITLPGVPTDQDFSASAEIWRFFRGYRLGQFLAVNDLNGSSSGTAVWPNPCKDVLHFSQKTAVTLSDLSGKVLMQGEPGTELNVSDLPAGVYMLQTADKSGAVKVVKE